VERDRSLGAFSGRPLGAKGGVLALDFEFDRAARRAIGEIQSRVPGAERGLLSLTDEGGQLSLSAPDTSGNVSLAADDGEAEGHEDT
jgi:hypothetical protein